MNLRDLTWLQGWHVVGWTMIYFLAAGTVLALVGAVLRTLLRRANPNVRYAASLAVFTLIALLPFIIFAVTASRERQRPEFVPVIAREEFNAEAAENTEITPETVERIAIPPAPEIVGVPFTLDTLVAYLPWVWLTGTPLTFLLLATGLVGTERLRSQSRAITEGPIHTTCRQLRTSLRIGREVGLAVCDRVATPLLVGIVRPLILLPPAALTGWSPDELEMVLLHELAHVRRWDNAVNLAQRVVESLLFFHPAVWVVSTWVRRDREDCCDAVVVRHTAKPQAYAELLVNLASPPPLAGLVTPVALSEHPLTHRIRRILKLEDEPMLVTRKTLTVTAVAVVLLLSAVLLVPTFAQETSKEELNAEVAEEAEKTEKEESSGKFPTLEEQRAADVAYKLLGIELEPLTAEELARVKAMGYKGGMRITNRLELQGLDVGCLLVGLGVWPTESYKQVNEILTRPDLDQLTPLKYYVLHWVYGMGGSFVRETDEQAGKDLLTTGRIQVNLDAWRALPEIRDYQKAENEAYQEQQAAVFARRKEEQQQLKAEQERAKTAEEAERARQELRYDGKTFEEWVQRLRTELKYDSRRECIDALVAFSMNGMQKEANAVLLDLASQYDWKNQSYYEVQTPLILSLSNMPLEPRVQFILAAAESENPRLRDYARRVAEWLLDPDAETRARLEEKIPNLEFIPPEKRRGAGQGGIGGGMGGGFF